MRVLAMSDSFRTTSESRVLVSSLEEKETI
jgi:hypothetical protein